MLKLFYSPGACSLAPHIVLEEIGAPFELVLVSTSDGSTQKPDYLAINPKGRVPALQGLFGTTEILTEASAIMLYLAGRNPGSRLVPAEPVLQARVLEWLNWLSSAVHAMSIAQIWRPYRFVAEEGHYPDISSMGRKNLHQQYAYIEKLLGDGRDWAVAGAYYSIADIFLLVFYRWGNRIGLDMRTTYPIWTRLTEKVIARPAVQRAMECEGITLS